MAKAPRENFSVPEDPAVSGDVALVGGNDEGPDLDIEPSEKDDWDPPKGEPKPKADDGDFDQEDSRLAYEDTNEGPPEERGAQSRRARRNARRRDYMAQQTEEINQLKQHIDALGGVVSRLTTGQAGLAVNSLDSQINTLEQALRMADQELADAVATNNGAKYSEVNKLRDEVVGRLWQTKTNRENMARNAQAAYQQQPQQQQPQQQPRAPQADPAITEMVADRFERFQDRYPWFDTNSGDADCNIVRAIDAELVTQGYQRHTPVFWSMLEQKMSRYGLAPDRNGGGGDDEDAADERPPRRVNGGQALLGRDVDVPRRGGPPTGSGRSTRAGAGGYALSEWQRDTLRDEGLLEENLGDADVAKRDRIIAKWRKGADVLRRGRMN